MFLVMISLLVVYTFLVILTARGIIQRYLQQRENRVEEAKRFYQNIDQQKGDIVEQRIVLEKQASEIFTLYEITREITKKTNAEEAFEIFKTKLSENVRMQECRFISAIEGSDAELDRLNAQNDFVFTLKEKSRKLGFLSFKGLAEKDKEKVSILGHQFALALRRVKLYEEVEVLATTDSLTGVHTRRYFLERFQEEFTRSIARKIDLSFLMVDVDHFKDFNDQYGHLVGDQILKGVGEILKSNVREIDVIGRYGGEEFAVVLPDTDRDGAQFAAERIRSAVENALIKAYDTTVKITVSIGISTYPSDGKQATELIDKADWALYRAKKQGRNCVCSFGVYK